MIRLFRLLVLLLHRLLAFPSPAEVEAGTGKVLISFPIYGVDGKRHMEFLGRTVRFRPPLLATVLLGIFAWSLLTAAAAPAQDSTVLAVNIATAVLAIAAPFLPLAQLHLDGPKMVAVSMVVALVIAVGSSLLTGDLKLADLSGGALLPLLEKFTLIWSAQQAVFHLFKDSASIGPYLTDKPLLVAPPPAMA